MSKCGPLDVFMMAYTNTERHCFGGTLSCEYPSSSVFQVTNSQLILFAFISFVLLLICVVSNNLRYKQKKNGAVKVL